MCVETFDNPNPEAIKPICEMDAHELGDYVGNYFTHKNRQIGLKTTSEVASRMRAIDFRHKTERQAWARKIELANHKLTNQFLVILILISIQFGIYLWKF